MKTTFFSILFLAAFGLRAQPSVVASSGGFAANSSVSVSWTLGELAVRTGGGGAAGIVTQGFQQPEPSGTISTDEADAFFEKLTLFPNPTEAVVTLAFSAKKAGAVGWEIVSTDGRTVFESEKMDVAAGDFSKEIDCSRLAVGPYFFILKNEKGQRRMAPFLKIE